MRVIALAQHQGAALSERWVFGSTRGWLLSSSNDELFQSAGILVRWQGLIDVIRQQDYLALRVHDGDFNDILWLPNFEDLKSSVITLDDLDQSHSIYIDD